MSDNSGISWTHHTFNPWWGCVEVSKACDFCYAREWSKRLKHDVWGAAAPRRFFGEKHWNDPLRWNARARAAGERHRVFCASMADVAETHRDPAIMARMNAERRRLVNLIYATDHLDYLILTKRPQDLIKLFPEWADGFPFNVWALVTVENAETSWRLDVLCDELPAAVVKGVSYEPALGPISFAPWFSRGLSWVIDGGESNRDAIALARPSHPGWFLDHMDECRRAGVAYHFKQWGEWAPKRSDAAVDARIVMLDGRSMPVPEFRPVIHGLEADPVWMYLTGKSASGRLLAGREHDGFPDPEQSPYLIRSRQRTIGAPTA